MGVRRTGSLIRVLGRFSYCDGGRPRALRPSARRLVALVAVRGPLPRQDAAGLLWPELTQVRALGNLRTALWRVRQDSPDLIAQDGDVLQLSEVQVDYADVRAWAWRALRGEEPWTPVPDAATAELLPGWGDDWLVVPREELRLLQLYALEAVAQRLLMSGRLGEAAGLASAALTVDPIRESANRLLIEIHLREGNRWDALRQFHKYEQLVRTELGAEPSPGLTALVAPLAVARPLVADLRAAGRHRA
jgi:DNA-binding SARP family transcriptional activator